MRHVFTFCKRDLHFSIALGVIIALCIHFSPARPAPVFYAPDNTYDIGRKNKLFTPFRNDAIWAGSAIPGQRLAACSQYLNATGSHSCFR